MQDGLDSGSGYDTVLCIRLGEVSIIIKGFCQKTSVQRVVSFS